MQRNQSAPDSALNSQLAADDEIFFIDILLFLKHNYKTIAIMAVAGLGISVAYLSVAPKQFVAVAQISMAQIGANNNNLTPLGVNIEEPSLLIARLSSPTSFTPQALKSCGMDESVHQAATLANAIKLAPIKGVANLVELKTFGKTPEAASTCALAIFELIKTTQAQIVTPYIEEAKAKLFDDEDRLDKARNFVAKADKTGQAMGAAYLSTRDEIRYLLDEITSLKNIVTSNQSRVTRLIAPIYSDYIPISPKRRVVLAAGLFGGFLLGLLFAIGSMMWSRLKSDMQKSVS